MLRRLITLCLLALPLACSGGSPRCGNDASAACTRVLFVGNSYTFVNDLPSMFAKLAASGGHPTETGMAAEGSWTLADHAKSPVTGAKLASARWGVVVLQEQSEIPSSSSSRRDQMYPALRQLVRTIDDALAQPILFLTWAHRDGWPENRLADYGEMQAALDDGYEAIAREQGIPIAPMGYAWWTLLGQEPEPGLWQDDGSHPTKKGTYLAACVFYVSVFRESPEGLAYHGGLSAAEGARLQELAAKTVLGDPTRWGLPAAAGIGAR
jgi:uncharacterized protein DUF4886